MAAGWPNPRAVADPDQTHQVWVESRFPACPYLGSDPAREPRNMSEPIAIKTIFMVLAVIVAVMVAVAAGLLTWLSKAHPATAVMRAGAAFAATLGLAVAVMTATHIL